MSNYTHVQFISWEIYTGPNRGPQPWSMGKDGTSYTGIGEENAVDNRLDFEGQIADITERLQFTYKAIEKAHELAVKHPTTLKVFMAPEFLYRGKGGAYIHDLINGWIQGPPDEFKLTGFDGRFSGLFGYLQGFAADNNFDADGRYLNRFKDWLFVLVRQSVHLSQQGLRQMGDGLWIQLKWEKYIIRLSFSVGERISPVMLLSTRPASAIYLVSIS